MHRDKEIDFLRFIGISMIILAHCNPPAFLYQLRNFDVPLMFFISGLSLSVSKSFHTKRIKSYIADRFVRLIVPTWIMIFFLFFVFLPLKEGRFHPFDFRVQLWGSVFLTWGIGYVWVIRLFFLVSVVGFLFCKMAGKLNKTIQITLTAIIMLFYQAFLRNSQEYFGSCMDIKNGYCSSYILESIPYLCFFFLGFISRSLKTTFIVSLSIIGAVLFIYFASIYNINSTSFITSGADKYPAGPYYLSYSLFGVYLAYSLSPLISRTIEKIKLLGVIVNFISQNTIWLYMWHVLFLSLKIFQASNFIMMFTCLYGASATITFFQIKLVTAASNRIESNKAKSYLLKILTG